MTSLKCVFLTSDPVAMEMSVLQAHLNPHVFTISSFLFHCFSKNPAIFVQDFILKMYFAAISMHYIININICT